MKVFSPKWFTTKAKTTGKSPSSRGEIDGIKHQIKRSNSTKNWRRWFGYDPDPSDLIGEYIGSKIAEELSYSIYETANLPENIELSPKVELVLDEKMREIKLASKYLNDGMPNFIGCTLDEVWKGTLQPEQKIEGHCVMYANDSASKPDEANKVLRCGQEISTKIGNNEVKLTLEKKQLFQALKLSFLLGDHDVNPGNMYVVYDKASKKSQICRIDYGHAFCDLIKKWGRGKDHSPNIAPTRGYVLDALNREKINGGKSKLARDYRDIIPDHEFASILRQEIDQNALSKSLENCRGELNEFYSHSGNKLGRLKNKITRCFSTLTSKMGFGKESGSDIALQRAESFVKKNAEEMQSIANLIDVQAYVEDVANSKLSHSEALKKIDQIYKKDNRYLKDKSFNEDIEWVKSDKDPHAPKCSLPEYINKKIELTQNPAAKQNLESLAKLLNSISPPKKKESMGKFTAMQAARPKLGASIVLNSSQS